MRRDDAAGDKGGAIYNSGIDGSAWLALDHCTFSINSALSGGAIFSDGAGGRITLALNACTISGNAAAEDGGGGIYSGDSTISLRDTILAANVGSPGPDLFEHSNTTTTYGKNLIGDMSGSNGLTAGPTLIVDPNAMLAPLNYYGGVHATMPPVPGSPATDAGSDSDPTGTDQRELPGLVNGSLDIGAVEIQGNADSRAILSLAWGTDADGDGISFGNEFALGTNPSVSDRNNAANLAISMEQNGDAVISIGTNQGAIGYVGWFIEGSPDLKSWNRIFSTGEPLTENIDPREVATAATRGYYRFRSLLLPP